MPESSPTPATTCAASSAARSHWANPVPGAQAVIVREGKALLGRRRDDPGAGLWDLPGGFLHEGESALAGLRRELREETGLEVEPVEFLGTWSEPYEERIVLCLTWLARVTGGTERAGDDLVELGWFRREDRPRGAELAFPTFEEILSLWERRDEDPSRGGDDLELDRRAQQAGLAPIGLSRFERWAERLMRNLGPGGDHRAMDSPGTFHRIEDDLQGDWIANLAGEGVQAIEAYLAKHLAFLSYLDEASAA